MKTPSQPPAIYYIVGLQIWEYFSFYGMRALLILYLTHRMGFNDSHAISLFSAYASLVYVTPIFGGWLADRFLGNRIAVICGALMMTLGHFVLGCVPDSLSGLYFALAIIICGYGLFKSNISCLLGELYKPEDSRRDGGFSLMYAAGNLGSVISPIACGLVAQRYGWHLGFTLAGIGMAIGLLIFLTGQRHFIHTAGVNKKALRAINVVLPSWIWLVLTLLVAPFFFVILLKYHLTGYLLLPVSLVAAFLIVKMMLAAPEHRRALWQIVALMAVGMLFWVMAQQGGSSISLFIDHFVNRRCSGIEIPTALFQSVNAIAIITAGALLGWLSRSARPQSNGPVLWIKFIFGLLLMGCGFMLLAFNARSAHAPGQASMSIMIIGLSVMGVSELFIDPIAMARITRLDMPGVTGVLTGIYMLVTGALANWLAGVVAMNATEPQPNQSAMLGYQRFFSHMGIWTLALVALIAMLVAVFGLIGHKKPPCHQDK
ncbi:proton-dependent oligopeptide transporter, POT family [Izhakiella capsodis]|uniref:Proton-dependent oligopeptide transporter, POT family n=1 Tax=Izhakiella capsodis TaxID=1367852 RepID=A0A1I4VXG7_9GAMM|nr:oligopeptide:H+ symporter [Izhakiella capsodis]SFN05850.1 proton-dependent oligopeptide transporter, POT family [Izhakiella capsodis]